MDVRNYNYGETVFTELLFAPNEISRRKQFHKFLPMLGVNYSAEDLPDHTILIGEYGAAEVDAILDDFLADTGLPSDSAGARIESPPTIQSVAANSYL